MPIARCIAALVVAAVLSMPAVGFAQNPPFAQTQPLPAGPGSNQPPVDLNGDDRDEPRAPRPTRSSELPDTGSDPRMLILAGVALTLLGVGLRLRTADADLY